MFGKLRAVKNTLRRSLSQAGQDFWVIGEAFNGKRNGYFVELGSADGITLSNTFLLEKPLWLEWYLYRGESRCMFLNPKAEQGPSRTQAREGDCEGSDRIRRNNFVKYYGEIPSISR